ncbi:M28 family peptidase [Parabacteroides sp. Marseille-P3160]|uniref:M20 family metallopeptidase n=1 Tax=Parabacteroides sp. Marseille-P3160 TaxID=1917887 RepID=UPI0009BBECAF|nr:M28 family peptidase [Parabacteroides sp. Marseille-P3160]
MNRVYYFILSAILLLSCCSQKSEKSSSAETKPKARQAAPDFKADSAYAYIGKQAAFGPRVPNTKAHKDCGDYLTAELKRFGAEIFIQEATLTAYNGTSLQARNIIGAYHPEREKRIMLFAHWDSRPYADHDPDETNHRTPILGVDDGASGVGVLLEIARLLQQKSPDGVGIDILFFDAEDYGTPEFVTDNQKENTWCLGSQFWAKNPHVPNYKAEYGILLDMVGAKNATFYKEMISMRYAARYVDLLWNTARDLGYGKFFIHAPGTAVTDDHLYVIQGRNIPCVDIINYDPESDTGFGHYWHTLNDTMENIDRETLKAVGQTVLQVIYDN